MGMQHSQNLGNMKEELERYLWNEMEKNGHGSPFPRDVISDMLNKKMIKSEKEAWRTLEKWLRKDIYDYGCSLDLGWKKVGENWGKKTT